MARTSVAWRRESRQRNELALLDAHALRDLGIDRTEWLSIIAESLGSAHSTRRRVELLTAAAVAPTRLAGRPAPLRWASFAALLSRPRCWAAAAPARTR